MLARTSNDPANRRAGLSLIVVERGMAGYEVGRALPKIGIKVQDTVELSFTDVRVPVANLLGEEGQGFGYLGHNLPQERLAIAVGALAAARAAFDHTVDYVAQRKVFGKSVSHFQNTKFELAAMETDLTAGQAMLDTAVLQNVDGALNSVDAAKVKLFCTELQGRVVDRCLQLFGGYGYVTEYPIARLYADARVTRIYGGTSEVMKSIISKSLQALTTGPEPILTLRMRAEPANSGGWWPWARQAGRFPVQLGGRLKSEAIAPWCLVTAPKRSANGCRRRVCDTPATPRQRLQTADVLDAQQPSNMTARIQGISPADRTRQINATRVQLPDPARTKGPLESPPPATST